MPQLNGYDSWNIDNDNKSMSSAQKPLLFVLIEYVTLLFTFNVIASLSKQLFTELCPFYMKELIKNVSLKLPEGT